MGYSFARVSAAATLRVEDYFQQGRRSWLRLHEKGGKRHEVPCHHALDEDLDVKAPGSKLPFDDFHLAIFMALSLTDRDELALDVDIRHPAG